MAIASGLTAAGPAEAQQQSTTVRNTYGEVGILDMPSGHMAPDGQLSFTAGDIGRTQRFNLAFQALPWLEASFRYSHVPDWGGDPHYYDRSFGLKIRLVKESQNLPDVSLGIRDFLGTGVYASEYIAASKRIGDLDVTTGLGWGRLADNAVFSNPFGLLSSSFKTRTAASGGVGLINFGEFFHGRETGVFGGLSWQTPVEGLKLLAEYSSDNYTSESKFTGGLRVRSPVNVGLSYSPLESLVLSAGWFYGTTYGLTVSLNGDPTTTLPSAIRLGPKPPQPALRNDIQQQGALSLMLDRNAQVEAARAGSPWVKVPTETERQRQVLLQALLSEGSGVRDIDIEGKSLLVDAQRSGNNEAQCAKYAEIASASGARMTTLAMADLRRPDGKVTICPIATGSGRLVSVADKTNPYQTSTADPAAFEHQLAADLGQQSLSLDAVSIGGSELWLYFENFHYLNESEAIGRAARVLMADAPPSIEIFHLISTSNNVPLQQVSLVRSALERAAVTGASASELGDAISVSPPALDNPALDTGDSNYPRTYWTIGPKFTEHFFDPDRPLQFQIFGDAQGAVALAPGFAVGLGVTANIYNNVNFSRPPGSALPHVRTDVLQYIKKGGTGISYLNAIYKTRLARDVFAEVNAGYLEDMFAGVGGQILWRPEGQRFAIGADLYEVWKRDFNRLFGVQGYHVLTGHASIYYESPWYGLNFNLHVGRYLAGDYGATIEMTRRFSTGVEIGAFATFTNVPFSKFGEGSFDKGIIIRIPFEWELPVYSQSSFDFIMHSLTRDGGQRLAGDDSLYWDLRRTSYGDITEHLNDVVTP